MEIRARYVLIGAFTLAVIAAGFGFVYWLNNAGGLRERAVYRVRFEGSVSGLLAGSAVLFNGIRVGEVTGPAAQSGQPAPGAGDDRHRPQARRCAPTPRSASTSRASRDRP